MHTVQLCGIQLRSRTLGFHYGLRQHRLESTISLSLRFGWNIRSPASLMLIIKDICKK